MSLNDSDFLRPALNRPTPNVPPARQDLDTNLDDARQQIIALQRKKEELERAKGELEEMRRRHEEYLRGRAEMIDALNRGLVVLEHEQIETQRMLDLIVRTREKFKQESSTIEALSDAAWTSDTLKSELSKSLAAIEQARMEFNSACMRIEALRGKSPEDLPPTPLEQFTGNSASTERMGFSQALKLGVAFTLPLLTILLFIFMTLLLKR